MALSAHPEASLRQRTGEAFEAKRAIARWAAAQIQPGETLLLDAGSTVGALAHELRTAKNVTVATTGLTALQELADVRDRPRRMPRRHAAPPQPGLRRPADRGRPGTADLRPRLPRRGRRHAEARDLRGRPAPDPAEGAHGTPRRPRLRPRPRRESWAAAPSTPGPRCPRAGPWSRTTRPTPASSTSCTAAGSPRSWPSPRRRIPELGRTDRKGPGAGTRLALSVPPFSVAFAAFRSLRRRRPVRRAAGCPGGRRSNSR